METPLQHCFVRNLCPIAQPNIYFGWGRTSSTEVGPDMQAPGHPYRSHSKTSPLGKNSNKTNFKQSLAMITFSIKIAFMKSYTIAKEIMIFISIILLIPIFLGCQKTENKLEVLAKIKLMEDLNSFNPTNDIASGLVSAFISQRKIPYLKSIAEYKRLDVAVWLTEANVNFEKGFKKDSIAHLVIDTTIYYIPIASWSDGIPLVIGADLNYLNDRLLDGINTNEQNDFLFWATYINIVDIEQDVAQLEIVNSGGPKSFDRKTIIQPKLPGAYLVPFEDGYSTRAGHPGTTMLYAEKDFWDKISTPESFLPYEFALVHVSTFYRSAYQSPGVADARLFWGYGSCETTWMNSDQLNQYLVSSKELIDQNNPAIVFNDLVIGYFHWNCWNFVCYPSWCYTPGNSGPYYGHWFQHAITFYIYRRITIGQLD